MNKPLSRRWFMKTAALAPVAAKDAAAKIGVRGISSFGVGSDMIIGSAHAPVPPASAEYVTYLKERMGEILTGKASELQRRNIKKHTLMLDPDLGSLRSVSPSFARVVQIERTIERTRIEDIEDTNRQLSKLTGGIL